MSKSLIDANEVLDFIENLGHYSDNPDYDNGYRSGVFAVWDKLVDMPRVDPVHAVNACYCKECQYYEPFRDYPDCSKILTYGHCYYWKYEEGESPNEVDENDFCSKGRKDCNK